MSVLSMLGMLGGGALGGLFGGASQGLFSKTPAPRIRWYPTMKENQESTYNSLLSYLASRMGKPLVDLGSWQDWAENNWRRYRKATMGTFTKRTLPAIREAYGGRGAIYSGARTRAELDAARMLSQDAAAKRADLWTQSLQNFVATRPEMNPALQMLMGAVQIPTFGVVASPGVPSVGNQAAAGALQGLGGGLNTLSALSLLNYMNPRTQNSNYSANVGTLSPWSQQYYATGLLPPQQRGWI